MPIFYDLIASYYAKGKWQWRQGYSFCFESYHFLIRKCFFTPAYFSLFNLTCFFHRHWRFTGQQGKRGDHLLFLSTISTRSETLRHLFELCMWDNYHVFLIATLVFTRLLHDKIYHLIELPFEWLIDNAMFVCLLDELILGFLLQRFVI